MTVHNYRYRQVHKTLNGVNPSSSFRDMRSAKSGLNLWQIWQVFGPWASPYGANGEMTMTVHIYRPRQFHRTSNGENPSSGYRDMSSASLAAARPPEPWRQYPSSPKGWGVKSMKINLICRNETLSFTNAITHWGRVTHICVNKLTIIGSNNGLSPGRRQAIIWTNAGILLIGPMGTNFNEILIEIQTFSFKKMHLKMSSGKSRPSWLASMW